MSMSVHMRAFVCERMSVCTCVYVSVWPGEGGGERQHSHMWEQLSTASFINDLNSSVSRNV